MSVLVAIANGSEDIEAVTIIDVLRRADIAVTVASVHEEQQITAARGTVIVADTTLAALTAEEQPDFELIALPGGLPGAQHLFESQALKQMLQAQRDQQRWIAAICAAPAVVLSGHGLLAGVEATAHPLFMAQLSGAIPSEENVVVDQPFITSRGPGTALVFSLAIVKALKGEAVAEAVAAPMCLD